ncbi:MAG: hypothetical protein JW798_04360, partial [Prolixibacteraceae bacterium]|nr:hypothetical protein [Prolixibacteraceae bacterium]
VLSVETDQLGISAGLQDRVAQAYEHPVFMNFDKELMKKQGFGEYTPLDIYKLPPLYIAFRKDQSQGSEVTHNNLRARYDIGEKIVHMAMAEWAGLAEDFLSSIGRNDFSRVHQLINRNFDLRESLIEISEENKEMVKLARSVGVSAKFTGSGGAIIGTYSTEEQYKELEKLLLKKDIGVIKPNIVTNANL